MVSSRAMISVCAIFRDEADFLPRTVPTWVPLVDELVLMDTGSVDRSREKIEGLFHLSREAPGGRSSRWTSEPCVEHVVDTESNRVLRVVTLLDPWRARSVAAG